MNMGRAEVERLLGDAGWYRGRTRHVDMDRIRALFAQHGCVFDDRAREYIDEFDELRIPYIRNGREDRIDLRFGYACELADPEWLGHYGETLGSPLVPVGPANHQHLFVLRACTGSFYVAFDNYLAAAGNSPLDMVERVVTQNFRELR